jgi:hypothetical protein
MTETICGSYKLGLSFSCFKKLDGTSIVVVVL